MLSTLYWYGTVPIANINRTVRSTGTILVPEYYAASVSCILFVLVLYSYAVR